MHGTLVWKFGATQPIQRENIKLPMCLVSWFFIMNYKPDVAKNYKYKHMKTQLNFSEIQCHI